MYSAALVNVMQLVYMLHFFSNNVFSKPPEEKSRVKSGGQGGQDISSLFLSINQEIPCPRRHEHDGRRELICKGSSETLEVFAGHYPGTPHGMTAHDVARHFLSLSDTCPNTSQIWESLLFGLGIHN
jgi:hypothetical protein